MPDSVLAARGAGIRVVLLSCKKTFPVWLKFHCENSCSKLADPQVMITGDYLLTAIAIAKNVASLHDMDSCTLWAGLCSSSHRVSML